MSSSLHFPFVFRLCAVIRMSCVFLWYIFYKTIIYWATYLFNLYLKYEIIKKREKQQGNIHPSQPCVSFVLYNNALYKSFIIFTPNGRPNPHPKYHFSTFDWRMSLHITGPTNVAGISPFKKEWCVMFLI